MVMSDWFGVYSVTDSINASLDLEMPGVEKWRTQDKVKRSIVAKKTTLRIIKARARKVLELVKRVCAINAEVRAHSIKYLKATSYLVSQVINGDGVERWQKSDEDSALMRKVGAQSLVLLKNENNVLPLKTNIQTIAIIGPNAKASVISGGGSASLRASYIVTPYDGIIAALPKDVKVVYHEGCVGKFTSTPNN